jgi:hypothetical protein
VSVSASPLSKSESTPLCHRGSSWLVGLVSLVCIVLVMLVTLVKQTSFYNAIEIVILESVESAI